MKIQKVNLKAYRHSHPHPMTPTSQETGGDLVGTALKGERTAVRQVYPGIRVRMPVTGAVTLGASTFSTMHVDLRSSPLIQKLKLKAHLQYKSCNIFFELY